MTDQDRCPGTNRHGDQCGHPPGWGTDHDSGPCKFHGGASTGPTSEEGKETSSQNAVSHGAYRKHFTRHLTEDEKEAFEEARRALENPEDAQEVARMAASICLIQFDRTGDERFMRRFESICDKFGIAPTDELQISGSVTVEEEFMNNLRQYHGDE